LLDFFAATSSSSIGAGDNGGVIECPHQHFSRLPYKRASCKALKTTHKGSKWSSNDSLYMTISSKYTTTKRPIKAHKTLFISLIKVLGALVKPKGITLEEKCPSTTTGTFGRC
jgi:hypothetical protein